jgi:hypothetical protein
MKKSMPIKSMLKQLIKRRSQLAAPNKTTTLKKHIKTNEF